MRSTLLLLFWPVRNVYLGSQRLESFGCNTKKCFKLFRTPDQLSDAALTSNTGGGGASTDGGQKQLKIIYKHGGGGLAGEETDLADVNCLEKKYV